MRNTFVKYLAIEITNNIFSAAATEVKNYDTTETRITMNFLRLN